MTISVCMAYWKRQEALDRSLAAYRRHYPHLDLEIVVADDGSPEPVQAPGCVVVSLPRKQSALNPCVPLNAAVRASTGELIVLTNPEIEHVEPVLEQMAAMIEHPSQYVTAACVDADGSVLAGAGVDYRKDGRLPVPPGAHFHFCAMLTRELFDHVGGFDESYRYGQAYEDADWLWRCYEAGARFLHHPVAVRHYRTATAWGLPLNEKRYLKRWAHTVTLP